MFGLQPHRHYSGYTSVAVTIPTTLWRGGLRPQSKHPHNPSVNVSSCLICSGWPQWIRVICINKIIQRNGMAWHGIKTRCCHFSCSHVSCCVQATLARFICVVIVNSDTLTVNYSIKQSQFTKLISEPRARNPEESNEAFDRAIRE